MSLFPQLGFLLFGSALVVGACTSFGSGGGDPTVSPEASIPAEASTILPTPDSGLPAVSDAGTDALPPRDAATSFCATKTDTLFCSSFDGPNINDGWTSLGTELASFSQVPSFTSAPFGARAKLSGDGTPTTPSATLVKPINWAGSGIVVDVDIDATEIFETTIGHISSLNVAISNDPPLYTTIAFAAEGATTLFVVDGADASAAKSYPFIRPPKGFVHYQLSVNFLLKQVTLKVNGALVVDRMSGIFATPARPVYLSAGAAGDPGATGALTFDNYVVTKLN